MIRKYRPAESDEVLHLGAAASVQAHPFLGDEFLEQERREIREAHLPNAETWVWETDGRVVGFIFLLGSEVGAIFVDPALQRNGIGRALMDHASARQGALEVEVFRDNPIGRAFYARSGFKPIAQKVHEPTGQPIVRLRLAASEPTGG